MRDSSCISNGRIHELVWFGFVAFSRFTCLSTALLSLLHVAGKSILNQSWRGLALSGQSKHKPQVLSMGDDWGLIQEVYCCVSACSWPCKAAPSVDRRFKSVNSFWVWRNQSWKVDRVCLKVMGVPRFQDSNLVDSASSIRLSQRLSHACLSINNFIRETANGSLYQL